MKKIYDVWTDSYDAWGAIAAVFLTLFAIIFALALAFGSMCLQAWLVMLLWNWVAVELFGAPILTFWVAFGLRWLCVLLFKTRVTVNKEK